ncbi:MAG TPA: hypothetical protein GXX75_06985 [Clostridiales bacterium]|nr:hypothetical protein [Clostridiales bacterium]
MGENELMVNIPYSRLEVLLDTETRSEVLKTMVMKNDYVSNEKIADILGFKLPPYKRDKDPKEVV